MKKIVITFILLFCLINLTSAQITYNKTFQLDTQVYGPATEFFDVSEDGKFIYVLGEYQDDNNSSIYETTSFVLTFSQNGNILHRINFKPSAHYSNFVPIDNDGFAVIASDNVDSFSILKIYPLSDTIIEIKKPTNISPFGGGFRQLSRTKDNHFLIAGSIYSPSPNYGIGKIYMKLDSLGNTVWRKDSMTYSPESNRTTQMIELQNGNYLLIGSRQYKNYAFSTFESQGHFKILDSSGVVLSTTYTDNNRLLTFGHAKALDNGEILIAGTERFTSGLGAADVELRGYICKYDTTGQLLWEYSLDKDYDYFSGRFIVLDDGSCIASGIRGDTIPNHLVYGQIDSVKSHGFLLKLAPDGTKIWERKFTALDSLSITNRYLFATVQMENGDFVIVGRTRYHYNFTHGTVGWIIRTDSFGCIVPGCQLLNDTENQTFDDINQLTVFPNPTSDLITFRFEKPLNNGSIRIFNSLGQALKMQEVINNQEQINCSNWQNGMYFYGIYDNNRLVKTGQFLKQ